MKRREGERAPTVRLVGGGVERAEPGSAPAPAPAPAQARIDNDDRVLDLVAPVLTLTLGERIGWALQWDDQHLTSGVVSLDGSGGAGLALVRFRTWLGELLDLSRAVLVAYEALSPVDRAVVSPSGVCARHLEGVLLARLEGRVAYVAPEREEVRSNLVGRTPGGLRRLWDAARARWGRPAASDQEAHALAVLAWVVDVIGDPGAA